MLSRFLEMVMVRRVVAEGPAGKAGPAIGPAETAGRGSGRRWDASFCGLLFVAALGTHVYLATINWTWGFMPGHEFRQTQTALITYYIDHDNNFSPFYEQPLFGKPWGVQLEFPLYEWAVTWLSRATHWRHVIAARTLSMASFYLTLPALYLVLGRLGLPRRRRLVVLAAVLVTPVYLFYARAFLIDPMAVMFSAWFLALFVETMERRHWALLVACTLCGTAAGLIKSLVFFAWAVPAAACGAWKLWRVLAEKGGVRRFAQTAAWGLGTVVVPAIALGWWVRVTDAAKETHPSAYIFTSRSLSHDNYGTFSLASRVSVASWRELLARWDEAVAQPWVVVAVVVLGAVLFKRERWRVLGAAALFLVPQLAIPYAYGGQDYYYYTCAAFAAAAFGFAINGVLEAGWPRVLRWTLALLPLAAMLETHRRTYYLWQSPKSHGGSQLAFALRDLLPPGSVIVVAGIDWAAMLPYYSQHRALMIRQGLERDAAQLDRMFNALDGEDVGALVLVGAQRDNAYLLDRAATAFNIDRHIAFSDETADVYLNRFYFHFIVEERLRGGNVYGLKLGGASSDGAAQPRTPLPPGLAASAFPMVAPAPKAFQARFGYSVWHEERGTLLNAHPDLDLWVALPPGATVVQWEFGILRGAWDRSDGGTNGVEFCVDVEGADGTTRRLFDRVLKPKENAGDRGDQLVSIPLQARAGETLVFRTRPNQNDYAFDWAYWKSIRVK